MALQPDIKLDKKYNEEIIELEVYDADQDKIHQYEIHVLKVDEILLETDFITLYSDRWEDVPAGCESTEAKLIIFKRDGKLYIAIQYHHHYSLDNMLKVENRRWYEIFEVPPIKNINKILTEIRDLTPDDP